jgi:cation transport ATPase
VCEHWTDGSALIQLALTLTSASKHLYSQAIADYALDCIEPPNNSHSPRAKNRDTRFDVKTVAGRGLLATRSGKDVVALGSLRWMDENQLHCGPRLSAVLNDPATSNKPVVAIGFDGQIRGLFFLEETIRSEATDVVATLQVLGLNQAVLTGDRAARAQTFSKKFGLDVCAELLPEQKLSAIRAAHDRYGCVAMIGDGLNDAPALAAADIGIALGCGADVSRDSADICLLSSNLELIPWTYRFARRTVSTIRTNLVWSFGYNSVGVIFAAAGQLHPALAAALMVVSSVVVLCNSLKLSFDDSDDAALMESDSNTATDGSVITAGSKSTGVRS